MSLSMLLSVLIILQELINLQTRRKMLNMKMYSMYAADRIFTPDELKLLEKHQQHEILDNLVYPYPYCTGALETSWNDMGCIC